MTGLIRQSPVLFGLFVIATTAMAANNNNNGNGNRQLLFKPMIIGGVNSLPQDHRFFIQYGLCGASLIHGDIALTAAHCDPDSEVKRLLVGAKQRDSNKFDAVYTKLQKNDKGENIRVRHPNYNSVTKDFDMMILKLDGWMTHPIVKLNNIISHPVAGERVRAIGMGKMANGLYSQYLQQADLLVNETSACQVYGTRFNPNNMLCAAAFGRDSCQGDSGGPLLNINGEQVGVVTHGNGCGNTSYPGVYAKVSSATDWIRRTTCVLSDNPPEWCTDLGFTSKHEIGKVRIRIDEVRDDYPWDAGWRLRKVEGNRTLIALPDGYAAGRNMERTVSSYYLNLEGGLYEAEFRDSWGDGNTVGIDGYYRGTRFYFDVDSGTFRETTFFNIAESFSTKKVTFDVRTWDNRRLLRGRDKS